MEVVMSITRENFANKLQEEINGSLGVLFDKYEEARQKIIKSLTDSENPASNSQVAKEMEGIKTYLAANPSLLLTDDDILKKAIANAAKKEAFESCVNEWSNDTQRISSMGQGKAMLTKLQSAWKSWNDGIFTFITSDIAGDFQDVFKEWQSASNHTEDGKDKKNLVQIFVEHTQHGNLASYMEETFDVKNKNAQYSMVADLRDAGSTNIANLAAMQSDYSQLNNLSARNLAAKATENEAKQANNGKKIDGFPPNVVTSVQGETPIANANGVTGGTHAETTTPLTVPNQPAQAPAFPARTT